MADVILNLVNIPIFKKLLSMPLQDLFNGIENQNLRDFILCTNEVDFMKLEKGPYNIVLQNQIPDEDDGSLSWALLKNNVRYINVETRLGYLTQKKKILSYIEKKLN